MYKSSPVEDRISILHSIGAGLRQDRQATAWQPLLAQAATDPDARMRRAAMETLGAQPPKVAAALVGPSVSDEDAETRSAAAGVVLSIIGGQRSVIAGPRSSRHAEIIQEAQEAEMGPSFPGRKPGRTNAPPATAQQIAAWHTALQQKAGAAPGLLTAAAIYVTGHSNLDLPVLQHALEKADKTALAQFARSPALAAIMPRLPWPAGQAVVQRFCAEPALFLRMLNFVGEKPAGLADFLFDPARFRAAVEPASQEELESALPQLLQARQARWSLLSATPRVEALVAALLEATNAAWRAAAVYCVGQRDDAGALSALERALKDPNPWVRATAAAGLASAMKDRPVLEQRLGPLVADPDKRVAQRAAAGLLEPETRALAGLDWFGQFEFEKIHVWSFTGTDEQRPLNMLEGNPPFLGQVRQRLGGAAPDDAALDALLLAQYGDFSGLDRLLAGSQSDAQKQDEFGGPVLAAVALSKDAKYLPWLRKLAATAKDDSDFRKVLQGLRGMAGAEARQLRLDINRRARAASAVVE
jgi:HEAT repeat protein